MILGRLNKFRIKKIFNRPNAENAKWKILGLSIIRSVEQILVIKMFNRPNAKIQVNNLRSFDY